MSEIIFVSKPERVTDQGTIVSSFSLALLGEKLPQGMLGEFSIHERADGTSAAYTLLQGHSKHGRRYNSFHGANAGIDAQKNVHNWARRLLRKAGR